MTLTEFLLARIAEDKAKGRAAHALWGAERDGSPHAPDFEVWANDDAMTAHVAVGADRWLAECEAKGRIVEQHRAEPRDSRPQFADLPDRCTVCTETGNYDLPMLVWPCPTVLALALPYSDHPDFRPEWRA